MDNFSGVRLSEWLFRQSSVWTTIHIGDCLINHSDSLTSEHLFRQSHVWTAVQTGLVPNGILSIILRPGELNLLLTNYFIPPLTLYSIENHKLECQIISIGNDINDRTKTTTSQEYDRQHHGQPKSKPIYFGHKNFIDPFFPIKSILHNVLKIKCFKSQNFIFLF